MRILSLRLKNLNSLEGTWSIDFTSEAFLQNGLFVITGPTGSGKTTILDAISLALYGRTPRLQRINKSTNDIMTRGCGECFSEVTFATSEGTFRSLFSQRRARTLATGALQDQKREISDATSGKILASTLKEADETIIRLVGMEFDQFSRSVMLAQGQFAAFLQAGSDQRGPILEQITGTGIYSDISIAVQVRYRTEKETLEHLRRELDGIVPLTEEELSAIHDESKRLEETSALLGSRLSLVEQAIRWYDEGATLRYRQEVLSQSIERLTEDERAFIPESERLSRYEKARPLAADWEELQRSAASVEQSAIQHDQLEHELLELKASEEHARHTYEETLRVLSDKHSEHKALSSLLKVVREKEILIKRAAEEHLLRSQETEALRSECDATLLQIESISQEIDRIVAETQQARAYVESHAEDAPLTGVLPLLIERLDKLEQMTRKQQAVERTISELEASIGKLQQNLEFALQELDMRQVESQQNKHRLESLKQEHAELSRHGDGRPLHQQSREVAESRARAEDSLEKVRRFIQLRQKKSDDEANLADTERELQATKDLSETNRRLISALQRTLDMSRRYRDILRIREELSEGQPCPVCGSEHHPYLRFQDAPLPQSEQETDGTAPETSERELESARQTSEALHRRLGMQETETENLRTSIRTLQEEMERLESALGRRLDKEDDHSLMSRHTEELEALRTSYDEIQKKIDDQETLGHSMEEAQEAVAVSNEQAESARRIADTRAEELSRTKSLLRQTSAGHQELETERIRAIAAVETELGSLAGAYSLATPQEISRARDGLTDREQLFRSRRTICEGATSAIGALSMKMEERNQALLHCNSRLSDAMEKEDDANNRITSLRKERSILFADKDCDAEETRIEQELSLASLLTEQSRTRLTEIETKYISTQERVEELKSSLSDARATLVQRDASFTARLGEHGFTCRQEFVDSLLTEVDESVLKRKAEALRTRRLKMEAEANEVAASLSEHAARRPDAQFDNESTLPSIQRQTRKEYEESLLRIGALRRKLEENRELNEKKERSVLEVARQNKILETWDALYALIGSSDGKKFRNYAQGITFDQLLAHANRKLTVMTDRYLLVRSDTEALDISVVDNYQGGEIRTTKNLSGGESFLISLALALALSQMASRHVRIDSLFLDEGFGTLDEQTLDTALDALSMLRDDGKLIGLISHVPALRERIPTRIQVIKGSGGTSRLSGPGCTRE